jgi:hypothetical protein
VEDDPSLVPVGLVKTGDGVVLFYCNCHSDVWTGTASLYVPYPTVSMSFLVQENRYLFAHPIIGPMSL